MSITSIQIHTSPWNQWKDYLITFFRFNLNSTIVVCAYSACKIIWYPEVLIHQTVKFETQRVHCLLSKAVGGCPTTYSLCSVYIYTFTSNNIKSPKHFHLWPLIFLLLISTYWHNTIDMTSRFSDFSNSSCHLMGKRTIVCAILLHPLTSLKRAP